MEVSIASKHKWRYGLLGLALLAVTVRVIAVLAVGSYRLDNVTYEHGEIARNIVEGRGFAVRWMGADGPTSQQAPVYPTMLAGFYFLFGVGTPASLAAMQLTQALLGGVLAIALVLLGRELVPQFPSASWIAGLGAALYPTLVYTATQIQVAATATTLTVMVLWLGARAARTATLSSAIACGAASALLILTDPILALIVAVAATMIAVNSKSPVRQVIAVVAVCATVVAPWIVRNHRVHGELVFVKSTFGYAFWQGNHVRSYGTDKIPLERPVAPDRATAKEWFGLRDFERSLWRTRLVDTLYIDDAVLENERIAELGRLPEPARSRELLGESLTYLREHPGHYVRLCLQRLRYFLLFDETNPKSQVALYRASHLSLLAASLAGLLIAWRLAGQLWPTYLAFGLVTMFHTLTIVSARFHIPLEPLQILWMGAGLSLCAARWCNRMACRGRADLVERAALPVRLSGVSRA